MKKLMRLLLSIVLLLALAQAPVFALSLEDDINSAKIASQYVDILCEVADLQVSNENLDTYIASALKERSVNFSPENLSAGTEFSDVVQRKITAKVFTRCPIKAATWLVSQASDKNATQEN